MEKQSTQRFWHLLLERRQGMNTLTRSTKASGRTTRCTAGAFTPGLIKGGTQASIILTKNKAMGLMSGRMAGSILGIGKMANNPVLGFICCLIKPKKWVCGRMVRGSSGWIKSLNSQRGGMSLGSGKRKR